MRDLEAITFQRKLQTWSRILECINSWLNCFQGNIIRWNKKVTNSLGLVRVALSLITVQPACRAIRPLNLNTLRIRCLHEFEQSTSARKLVALSLPVMPLLCFLQLNGRCSNLPEREHGSGLFSFQSQCAPRWTDR